MDNVKSRVEKIRSELHEFIRSTISHDTFDVIIPIVRKGLFILEVSDINRESNYKVYLLPLSENISLQGKKVLILDNSCYSGQTLLNALEELKRSQLEKERSKIGVFVKCKSCKAPIDYFKYEVEEMSMTNI
jgi:hypoxanthine phosphoribosyltransferase